MSSAVASRSTPLDQAERVRALAPGRSILVQAPAGSGKTDLLTRRFLRLLATVDEPGQVVAITFTNAAAAEMRHRIVSELEKAAAPSSPSTAPAEFTSHEAEPTKFQGATLAAPHLRSKKQRASAPDGQLSFFEFATPVEPSAPPDADEFSVDSLARAALAHSRARGWKLLDLPAQIRISTIDSFCRDLALQQPLLSGLGAGLDIAEQPAELYRRAARQTLERIGQTDAALSQAIESLLLWRDNGWHEMEELLLSMLGQRDRWMHEFVLARELDLKALRERLERPFANAVHLSLTRLADLINQVPGAFTEALALARFGCEQTQGKRHRDLAELAEFPRPFHDAEALEEARRTYLCLGEFLLTQSGTFRSKPDTRLGFPAECKREKERLLVLIESLKSIPGLEAALAAVRGLPPARYPEDDWQIVRACFTLLRHAAAELQVVFAESGTVDFIQVAQIAQRVLTDEDGLPTDSALAVADGILHLLVDEFQDTSRRQHRLLASIVAAWPDRVGRSCFAVGDPMQSIYFFRDADAELFPRVRTIGLEIPGAEALKFDFAPLRANFRTNPILVDRLNQVFRQVFAANDGSGVTFSAADPCRGSSPELGSYLKLHLKFFPQTPRNKEAAPRSVELVENVQATQAAEIVSLIRAHLPLVEQARANGGKYRIAVLGRARNALAPVAQALREAGIPFRAVDLEKLSARPEVLDALALARALLNPMDRVAWLGVLRAPWCGLTLNDLHLLTSSDDPVLLSRAIPDLFTERRHLLSDAGRLLLGRVLPVFESVASMRGAQPTSSLGTWLESVWLSLGGAACVDAAARANLDLLWNCLDRLPEGEQDLLGPAVQTALDKLTALPDPAVSGDCGVQLMTIHKSKGLEFEVVIVPELQARSASSHGKLLSWLERGLTGPDESGEITEFLIAPLQSKGADRGKAKEWVDRVYRERESQEMRRILYVAATRAREELHLFACPACKQDNEGNLHLVEPSASLLATAWPALEEEVRARFEEWTAARTVPPAEEQVVESIAASMSTAAPGTIATSAAQSDLLVMPSAVKPTLLRRLPESFQAAGSSMRVEPTSLRAPSFPQQLAERMGSHEPQPSVFLRPIEPTLPKYLDSGARDNTSSRHEGGPLSRALGTAVHSLLEQLARLRETCDWDSARAALQKFEPRTAARIRATGIAPSQSAEIASDALQHTLNASHDPLGQWILSPHPQAASETGWTGVVSGSLRTVRVDRVFRAGLIPETEGDACWWVVDYKTVQVRDPGAEVDLSKLRPLFAPQLEAYASLLRKLQGTNALIRAALYYPRMSLLDWWEI